MSDRRRQILAAALALADERGLGALSMRAVASRVGVTPMALYPHVGTKDAMLDGLVELLIGEMITSGVASMGSPPETASWETMLRGAGVAARAVARAHPTVFPLLFNRPAVTGEAVLGVDFLYQAFQRAGIPDVDVPRLERFFTTFIVGFAISEVGGRFTGGTIEPRLRRAQIAPERAPAHHALASILDAEHDWDAEFEADLADFILMVKAIAARPAARPAARSRPAP